MEKAEEHKTEWLLRRMSSFGRFMAIDWLRDLDAGRPLTPYPSPYHNTGELRVSEDEMLEVLVAPYPGPGAEEHVKSKPSMGDVVRDDRVWQVVPGLLPQWAQFLRGNYPPDWPHVYGVAKRAREEEEEEEFEDTNARPRERGKLSRHGTATKKTKLHAEPGQKAKSILSAAIDDEVTRLLGLKPKERRPEPRSRLTNAEVGSWVALPAKAAPQVTDAELKEALKLKAPHREGSLELGEVAESDAATAQIRHRVHAANVKGSRQEHSPLPTSSPFLIKEEVQTLSPLVNRSTSPPLSSSPCWSPSWSPSGSPSRSPSPDPSFSPSPSISSSKPQDQENKDSIMVPQLHSQVNPIPVPQKIRRRFPALANSLNTTTFRPKRRWTQ
ncbi:hypothetical protein MMC30_000843 [Trapelia coarctata]|nr:hypothetical protein [Trapelia coarctata]